MKYAKDLPLIYVSPGFTKLTGYESAEALGQSARFLQGEIDTDVDMVAKMRHACATMTDTSVKLQNQRKDGSVFMSQSSLFHVFATESNCTHERHNSALMMCVHADVTGLTDEQCAERNASAEELKDVVQACLAEANQTDTRCLHDIRASMVPPPPVSMLDVMLKQGSNAWLVNNWGKKVKTLHAQEKVAIHADRKVDSAELQSIMERNQHNMDSLLSVEEEEGEGWEEEMVED